jgi:hypothetical protein
MNRPKYSIFTAGIHQKNLVHTDFGIKMKDRTIK